MTEQDSWQEFEEADSLSDNGEETEAFERFRSLAEAGFAPAMSRVALMYFDGSGVEKDIPESIKWDLAAIHNGDITSLGNLALTYCSLREFRQARYWFERAIENGDHDSAWELARLLHVSDAETANVLRLLDIAITSDSITEDSRERALQMKESLGQTVSER